MAKIQLSYRDEAKPDDIVTLGAFAQIGAKRRYGLEALSSGDPEPVLYGCWIEIVGPLVVKKVGTDAFDAWLQTVAEYELAAGADATDPPVAETPSSDSSPGSPPTSD